MAVGRVKHISPCLVGVPVNSNTTRHTACLDKKKRFAVHSATSTVPLQTGEEPSLGVAMHIIETLVLDDAWQRTETFCPQSRRF